MPWVKHVWVFLIFLWVQHRVILFFTIQPGFFNICELKAVIWLIILVSTFKREHWKHIFGNTDTAPTYTQPEEVLLPYNQLHISRHKHEQNVPQYYQRYKSSCLIEITSCFTGSQRGNYSCVQTFPGYTLSSLHLAIALSWT